LIQFRGDRLPARVAFVATDLSREVPVLGHPFSIYFLDVASGAASKKIDLGAEGAYQLAWSKDGALLAQACTFSGMVRIWQLSDFHLVYSAKAESGVVIQVHWGGPPGGEVLGWLSAFGDLRFWKIGEDSMAAVNQLKGSQIRAFSWSPDGKLLTLALQNSSTCSPSDCFTGTQVYDPIGRRSVNRTPYRGTGIPGLPEAIEWSPDGESIAALTSGGALVILNRLGRLIRVIQAPGNWAVCSMAWNPVAPIVAASSLEEILYFANPKTGSLARFK
jgi:hypothetical protein